MLYSDNMLVGDVNWIPFDSPEGSIRATVKTTLQPEGSSRDAHMEIGGQLPRGF
jgi:hypothetical protein